MIRRREIVICTVVCIFVAQCSLLYAFFVINQFDRVVVFPLQMITPHVPHKLVFTYKYDLLHTTEHHSTKEKTLYRNVAHINATLPLGWSAQVLDDARCLLEIERVPVLAYELTVQFLRQKRGMIRADICRGATLFNHGGVYLDVDVEPLSSNFAAMLISNMTQTQDMVTVIPAWEPSVAIFQAIVTIRIRRFNKVRTKSSI